MHRSGSDKEIRAFILQELQHLHQGMGILTWRQIHKLFFVCVFYKQIFVLVWFIVLLVLTEWLIFKPLQGFENIITLLAIDRVSYRTDKIVLHITFSFNQPFFGDIRVGCITYDTRVKCPVSSYLLKWGAGLLPRSCQSQLSGATNLCLGLKRIILMG